MMVWTWKPANQGCQRKPVAQLIGSSPAGGAEQGVELPQHLGGEQEK